MLKFLVPLLVAASSLAAQSRCTIPSGVGDTLAVKFSVPNDSVTTVAPGKAIVKRPATTSIFMRVWRGTKVLCADTIRVTDSATFHDTTVTNPVMVTGLYTWPLTSNVIPPCGFSLDTTQHLKTCVIDSLNSPMIKAGKRCMWTWYSVTADTVRCLAFPVSALPVQNPPPLIVPPVAADTTKVLPVAVDTTKALVPTPVPTPAVATASPTYKVTCHTNPKGKNVCDSVLVAVSAARLAVRKAPPVRLVALTSRKPAERDIPAVVPVREAVPRPRALPIYRAVRSFNYGRGLQCFDITGAPTECPAKLPPTRDTTPVARMEKRGAVTTCYDAKNVATLCGYHVFNNGKFRSAADTMTPKFLRGTKRNCQRYVQIGLALTCRDSVR